MSGPTSIDHARALMARGLSPIPVPHKLKGPTLRGWQTLRLAANDLPCYFNGAAGNVGALLGEPSGWIVDVDLDHARAVELADEFLPATGMEWGRASKPRSHRLYRLTHPTDTRKWASKSGGMIVELRSTGCQTIAPGSTHPSGEAVRWDADGEPAKIDPADLIAALEGLARAVRTDLGEASDTTGASALRPASASPHGPSNYGRQALRREASSVETAPQGTRNDSLNRAAFSVGMLIGGGELDRAEAEATLLTAAHSCGLPDAEARRTIASGIESGMKQPRRRPAQAVGPNGARSTYTGGGDDGDDGPRRSTATAIADLARGKYRLGRTLEGMPFAVALNGPNLTLPLLGQRSGFRQRLAAEYRRSFGRVASASSVANALLALQGDAMATDPEPVHLRVARSGGIVIDLGTADGCAVVVDTEGWRVVESSPVLFRRSELTLPLPTPERGGDAIADFRALLNVSDDEWPLVLGWIIAALIPDIPHPILLTGGLHGTGKTTFARLILSIVDPSPAPTRSPPADLDGWSVAMSGSYAACIDNLSTIPQWFNDALCCASTGAGLLKRTLYSDGDVTVLTFRRALILTSIDPGALRGDLADRLVLIDLEPIPPERRRPESAILADFAAMRGRVFGALLDVLASTLAAIPQVTVSGLPRMADFAMILAAMDRAIGIRALSAYTGQGERLAESVIVGDAVARAVADFARKRVEWQGTASELQLAMIPNPAPRDLPKTPQHLSGALKRAAPALLTLGVEVTFDRGSQQRLIRLRLAPRSASDSVVTSVSGVMAGGNPPPDAQNQGPGDDAAHVEGAHADRGIDNDEMSIPDAPAGGE